MFRIIRLPFLHPFYHIIRYKESPANCVKLSCAAQTAFDHALPVTVSSGLLENGWEEVIRGTQLNNHVS